MIQLPGKQLLIGYFGALSGPQRKITSIDTVRVPSPCSQQRSDQKGRAALNSTSLLRQGQAVKVSHLHSNQQRLTAQTNFGPEPERRRSAPIVARRV